MSIKVRPPLKDNLWYPIVIKENNETKIVEMLGKDVNEWNAKMHNPSFDLWGLYESQIRVY